MTRGISSSCFWLISRPDDVKARYRCDVATCAYQVCIGQNGLVSSVDVVDGIPGGDQNIIAAVQRWRYKPQPIPTCYLQYFEYHIDGGDECDRPEQAILSLRHQVEDLERRLTRAETVTWQLRSSAGVPPPPESHR